MIIPSLLLKQLYTFGSLENIETGARFTMKNRLNDATLIGIEYITINKTDIDLSDVSIEETTGNIFKVSHISEQQPFDFPLKKSINLNLPDLKLILGKHKVKIGFKTKEYGLLKVKVTDAISDKKAKTVSIPYSKDDDYSKDMIKKRQKFCRRFFWG